MKTVPHHTGLAVDRPLACPTTSSYSLDFGNVSRHRYRSLSNRSTIFTFKRRRLRVSPGIVIQVGEANRILTFERFVPLRTPVVKAAIYDQLPGSAASRLDG